MKNPKKVLYLITKSNWGGAQRYVYDLATNLDKTKFEVVVALGGKGTLAELLTHAGIRVIVIETLTRDISLRKELDFAKELWSILQTEKPDVLHVNSSKAGGVGTLIGRLTLTPRVIFTAHGWAFNEDRSFMQRIIIKGLHWITVLLSHRTIAVSNAIVTQMNWPFAIKKMKVIHPGRVIGVMYETVEARAKIADFFPQLQSYLTDPWIITIAELHPIKRLEVLVASMKQVVLHFPSLRCVIIGDGQLKESLQNLIKVNGLQEQVFLTGSITEAARFLKAGNLFVLPSKSESYGYVLHEAGLAQIPIVATHVGGIPDIIASRNEGLLVKADDTSALMQAIIDTLNNPQEAALRAERLAKKLKTRTTDTMVQATTALYELPIS